MGFGQYSYNGLGGPNETPVEKTGRTRTVFGSHANTAHVWAQQSYPRGKSSDGRMWFDGPTIYSYGTHFPIARFLDKRHDGKQVVLFTEARYSVSTGAHISHVRGALYGLDVIVIPVSDLRQFGTSKPDLQRCFDGLITRLADATRVAASLDPRMADRGAHDAAEVREQIAAFRTVFGAGFRVPADPVAWEARRVETANRRREKEKIADALLFIGRSSGAPENFVAADWLTVADLSIHSMECRLRDVDSLLKRLRSARLTLAKAKRYPGKVRRAAAIIRLLESGKADMSGRLAEARRTEARIRELRDLQIAEAYFQAPASPRPVVLANYETIGRLWSVAIREGRSELAGKLGALVHGVRFAIETAWREPHRPFNRERRTLDDWRNGEGSAYFEDSSGITRLRRKGESLETSRGAVVPFRAAVRAFKAAQQCRAAGAPWRRNGATIPVGTYQLDLIDRDGNIKAGCHSLAWPEMMNVAVREIPNELAPTFPLPVPVTA